MIDFRPGYYEWIVYVDDREIYSIGDLWDILSDDIIEAIDKGEHIVFKEDIEDSVDIIIDDMLLSFNNGEQLITEDMKQLIAHKNELHKLMVDRLCREYIM